MFEVQKFVTVTPLADGRIMVYERLVRPSDLHEVLGIGEGLELLEGVFCLVGGAPLVKVMAAANLEARGKLPAGTKLMSTGGTGVVITLAADYVLETVSETSWSHSQIQYVGEQQAHYLSRILIYAPPAIRQFDEPSGGDQTDLPDAGPFEKTALPAAAYAMGVMSSSEDSALGQNGAYYQTITDVRIPLEAIWLHQEGVPPAALPNLAGFVGNDQAIWGIDESYAPAWGHTIHYFGFAPMAGTYRRLLSFQHVTIPHGVRASLTLPQTHRLSTIYTAVADGGGSNVPHFTPGLLLGIGGLLLAERDEDFLGLRLHKAGFYAD